MRGRRKRLWMAAGALLLACLAWWRCRVDYVAAPEDFTVQGYRYDMWSRTEIGPFTLERVDDIEVTGEDATGNSRFYNTSPYAYSRDRLDLATSGPVSGYLVLYKENPVWGF